MKPITVENCREMLPQFQDGVNIEEKAAAWSTVHEFCYQNGMTNATEPTNSGIENVIHFINELLKKKNEA